MPTTYDVVQSYTLGSGTKTISFTSIPTTYTDLRLVFSGTCDDTGNDYLAMRFNDDSGANYWDRALQGDGTSATSGRSQDNFIFIGRRTMVSTEPELHTVDIFSYANSSYKNCLTTSSMDHNSFGRVVYTSNLWYSTDAINKITLTTPNIGRNFAAGSTATLYGIKNA